jgi:hypothetical protein
MQQTKPSHLSMLIHATCFGAMAGMLVLASCGDHCDLPAPCFTGNDLEYQSCIDHHEFSDGTDTEDANEAFRRCMCIEQSVVCVDGRTATLCVNEDMGRTSELQDTGTFSDGETTTFPQGYAACFGYDTCQFEQCTFDNQGLWFVECWAGSEGSFIAWDGKIFDTKKSVKRYCDGESYEEANKSCKPIYDDCSVVPEAECEGIPCSWYGSSCTGHIEDCDIHWEQSGCFEDGLCTWE